MKEEIAIKKKDRVVEIDFVRGILIWLMVIDHFFFDIGQLIPNIFKIDYLDPIRNLFQMANSYWTWNLRLEVRFIVLALFFLLSGISCYFSRSNLKRGLVITTVGLAISVGFCFYGKFIYTKIMHMGSPDYDAYVLFGAISCFGLSILIFTLIKFIFNLIFKKHKEDFKWVALGLGMIIIAFGIIFGVWKIHDGWAGPEIINPFREGDIEAIRESLLSNFPKFIIGLKQPVGADWLPLFPYLGFLFIGYFIGEFIYNKRESLLPKLPSRPEPGSEYGTIALYYSCILPYKGIKKFFTFSGKHSMLFYILHQVVLVILLCVIMLIKGYKFSFSL